MRLRYGMTTWAEIHAANKERSLRVRVKELEAFDSLLKARARVKELEAELQRYKDYVADCDVLDDYDVEPDSKREEEQG